jgi:hypothetical protein
MIKVLRKRHFQIWKVLALLIPAGFVLALLFRPEPAVNRMPVETSKPGQIDKRTGADSVSSPK